MGTTLVKNLASAPRNPLDESPMSTPKQPAVEALSSPRIWVAIACALLGLSGGLRFWRDRQFQALAAVNKTCPFPLKDLPKVLGSWHMIDESEAKLDPEIARTAGSSDHIIRTYRDDKSGEVVVVLVLYGLSSAVFAHIPEFCYPASGFQPDNTPTDHEFSIPGSPIPVRFRSARYTKELAGIHQYEEVYYTFLHYGQWSPEVAGRWKLFRYYPSMFKVQLQRTVSELSDETRNSPTESLLGEIVQEIDRRASQNRVATATVATTSGRK
jgi:Protein of unknown function (DUF3485)